MSLRFATGKSSQLFSIELLKRALPEVAASLKLGEPDAWRANYRRVFAELTRLEREADGLSLQSRLLDALHELVIDDSTAKTIRTVTIRGDGEPIGLSTLGVPTAEALISNQLAEPGVRIPLEAYDSALASESRVVPEHSMISIGANAELSLAPEWLSIGGRVVAVARSNEHKWLRLIEFAKKSAGELVIPVAAELVEGLTDDELQKLPSERLATLAGLDLAGELKSIRQWVADLVTTEESAKYVAVSTVYAPGSKQIIASMAQDALLATLMRALPPSRLVLGWLATPLESIVASPELLEARAAGYADRGFARRIRDFVLRVSFGGPKPPVADRVLDFSVSKQGSSYLLAKRIERWRAATARGAGFRTWFQVAPPAVTQSTVGHKFVRAAYRGATRFGITSFEPWMLRDLLAASLFGALAADLNVDESAAIHGGVWRSPYEPSSIWLPATILGWRAFI